MKKFLRAFKTQAEYLAFTASTEFILDNVSSCREGDLVYFNSEQCGGQGMHRTISGETYCDGYDKRVYLYKQVSYDGGVTWETTATTSSLVEKNSEDCGYVPPTPTNWDITAKFNVTSTSSPTPIGYNQYTSGFSKIEIDGVVQPSVTSAYTFSTTGEHTVKYKLADPTSIGFYALAGCTSLTSCTIGSGVTSIGINAFRNCSSLTSIYIPNSVTSIDEAAFYYCSGLTSVTIPSGITSIERSTFIGCTSLSDVNIPSGVTSIGISAFHWCSSLTSVTIPDSVTNINSSAFAQCTALSSCTIGSGVTSIGVQTFNNCRSLTSITIPDSVTSIGDDAFERCSGLTSVTVNTVTPPTLGTNVFSYTNNCPIYVPCDSVDTYKAASGWSTYASRIQAIPGSCIEWNITAIYNITDTANKTKIHNNKRTINKIKIDGITQPDNDFYYQFSTTGEHIINFSLTDKRIIGDNCFLHIDGLMDIDISDSVTSIGNYAFRECSSLTSIDIPDSVTSISSNTFAYCISLTSVTIPDSVTSIGSAAFEGCSGLTSVTIPDSVTSIGNNTFAYCSDLTSVTIPDSVTSIGSAAFYSCSSLTSIVSNAIIAPTIQSSTFQNVHSSGTLYVPSGSSGYDVWMGTGNYYLGLYNWAKVEQ